jgi:hypothetical protein
MRMPAFVRLNALKNISAGAFSFSSHTPDFSPIFLAFGIDTAKNHDILISANV